jgi:Tol biopolymer transport system component
VGTYEITQITNIQGSFDPAWSPDGTRILFTQADLATDSQIYELYVLDGTIEQITDLERLNMNPDWSPDGERFVFMNSSQGGITLYVMVDLPGAPHQLLTRSGSNENSDPTWNPLDGDIVLSQKPFGGGVPSLIRVSVDMLGISPADYVETSLAEEISIMPEIDPDYSPNAYWIAFESWPDGENHDIYVLYWDGSHRERVTTHPANDFDPAWRPMTDR